MPLMEILPNVEDGELARMLGSRSPRGRKLSPSLKKKVKNLKDKSSRLIKPRIHFKKHHIHTISPGVVQLDTDHRLRSPKLSRTMRGSKEIVCFVGTVGRGIEKEIKRLVKQKRLSEAYILDALGSVLVEDLVDQFQSRLDQHYKTQNKVVGLRFSPGYCDWPVTEQKKLFELLEPQTAGVALTESCLMQPRKSISGVIPLFPADNGQQPGGYNPCWECKRLDCTARRI
jgi:hypothetical protein